MSNEGLIEGLRGEEEDCRTQGSQEHGGRQVGLQRKVTDPCEGRKDVATCSVRRRAARA